MQIPLPPNEQERLEALRQYHILDTPPEDAFERITHLTARLLRVPIVLVSLVDEEREWFKAAYGVDTKQFDRDISFCTHTILADEVMVVPDVRDDERFASNPLVTGAPHIVFYAGAPLQNSAGFNLGVLCVIDTAPRQMGDDERATLADLAATVVDELELRLATARNRAEIAERKRIEEALRLSETRFRTLFEQFPLSVQMLAPDGSTLQVNRAWEKLWNVTLDDIAGYNMLQDEQLEAKGILPYIRRGFAGEATPIPPILYEPDQTLPVPGARPQWVESFICPVKEASGVIREVVLIHQNITERVHAADALRYRVELEKTITSISTRFINIEPHEVGRAIDRALHDIGEFAGVDRSYIFALNDDGVTISNTHEWCAPGVAPQIANLQNLPVERSRWLMEKMHRFEPALISRVADLPPEAAFEKEHLQAQNIKSLVVVPMIRGDALCGFLGFDSVGKERLWPPEDIGLLQMLGEIFVNALERQRAEEALQESERFLQSSLDALLDHIAILDETGVVIAVNAAWRRFAAANGITGASCNVGSNYLEVCEAQTGECKHEGGEVARGIREVIARQRDEFSLEYPCHGPDEQRWFLVRVTRFEGDGPVRVVVAHENVTERKLTEEKVRESNGILNAVIEGTTDSIFIKDIEGRYLLANAATARGIGRPIEEVIGKTDAELFPPEAARQLIEDDRIVIESGEIHTFEDALPLNDDVLIYYSNKVPHRDPDGNIIGVIGVARNITDRKRAEEELREQTETLETVNRIGQMLSAELDLQKLVQAITDAATEITDAQFGAFFYNLIDERGESYTLSTISGAPRAAFSKFPLTRDNTVFGPTFRDAGPVRVADLREDARFNQDAPYFEMLAGDPPVASYLAVPVVSRSGEVLGGLCLGHAEPGIFSARDERIIEGLAAQAAVAMDNARLFDSVQRERAKAEDASRLKDEFLAVVSHELRTPLSSILGWANLLRTTTLDAATAARALETIERNVKSQAQIVNDLLDVSRIVSSKLRLDVRAIDLVPVIEAAVDAVLPAVQAKAIEFQLRLGPETGPVPGDPDRLQQIIWNLLTNAVKFTPRGGRVEVRLERVDSHIAIVISDTGQGIKADFLPYVFERFRQADSSSTRQYGGLGLGLSIVRHLVEMHGGTVRAESAGPGQGTTFTVELPLLPVRTGDYGLPNKNGGNAHGAEVEQEHQSAIPNPQSAILRGLRVLVVEDEPTAREMIGVVLQQYGAEVEDVATAAAGLASLRRWRPDVMVSDIGMPEEDGYALIANVRALDPAHGGQTPAVALTAYARSEDRLKALAAGYQVHVPKPVEPAALVTAVASLAGRTGTE